MRTRRRVLIVDDEAEWAERAKGLLPAMCEWDVTYVTGCRDALSRVVAEADWDLLMVDYQLEDGSGEEVVRGARRVDRNVPIGLMSSFNKDAIGFSRDLSVECSTLPFLSKSRVEGGAYRTERRWLIEGYPFPTTFLEAELTAVGFETVQVVDEESWPHLPGDGAAAYYQLAIARRPL